MSPLARLRSIALRATMAASKLFVLVSARLGAFIAAPESSGDAGF